EVFGTNKRRSHCWMSGHPSNCEGCWLHVEFCRKLAKLARHLIITRLPVTHLIHGIIDKPTLSRTQLRPVAPAQEPATKRTVWENRQAFALGKGQDLHFSLTLHKVIHGLQRHRGCPVMGKT